MKTLKHIAIFIFSFTLFVGCGGKEDKKKPGFSYEKKADDTKKTEANPNDVIITSNDVMQFNKKEIKVKAGKPVKITLRHIGKLDVKVMGHNFVLLKQDVDLMTFANKAATFINNAYIPTDTKAVIAHTKLIGGGETAVVEFDAPAVGEYEFLCSFPGHAGLMRGKFIVEE